MDFEKNLVLNNYFVQLLGFEDFENLQNLLKNKEVGFDSDGRSNFLDAIINIEHSKISEEALIGYDKEIKKYVFNMRGNRNEQDFNLKYFQYIGVLFTEIFFEKYFNDKSGFVRELNGFLDEYNTKENTEISNFGEDNLKKIALSMATGSGKTLIMHINLWQFLKYLEKSGNEYDNIVLITPNEGLSEQHHNQMEKSGIKSKVYNGVIDDIKTETGEVLIIDIYKLIEEKEGEGVRVETSYFDGKNLVLVDEGHKGRKSEEEVWKNRREEIARDGFIVEYSATFRQVIGSNVNLLQEYGKTIIFDYSYKHFYLEGYGKDFYIYNLKNDKYSSKFKDLLLTANILSFYEQLLIFENNIENYREYDIEKPLMIFVGGTVSGKILKSDIPEILFFMNHILEDQKTFMDNIKKILDGSSGLTDNNDNDLFANQFNYLKNNKFNIEDLYKKVFRGKGTLELYDLLNAKGELGLKVSTSDEYFALVNVGNLSELKKILSKKFEIEEDRFKESLFFSIDEASSPINILIGSRKFLEGWDTPRVSGMGLLNMGSGEGPQIIQLFGRGIRLKGKNKSLKREENPEYSLGKLQTLFIFGLDADYIDKFLKAIKKEDVNFEERKIEIKFNRDKEWAKKLYTLEVDEKFDFHDNTLSLEIDDNILNKKQIKINLQPKLTHSHGLETQKLQTGAEESGSIIKYFDLIDWNAVYLKIIDYKIINNYNNLLIDKETIKNVIKKGNYSIIASKEQISVDKFDKIKDIENIVVMILENYIDKFYRSKEKKESMNFLKLNHINKEDDNLNFSEITVKIPERLIQDFKAIFENEDFYTKKVEKIPTIHFDKHLYSPLAIFKKGNEEIKTSPVKLNKGESKFIEHLKKYINGNPNKFEGKSVFILRNLSKKGIGFFQKTGGFFPDFILWVKDKSHQRMAFIDPKGIRNIGSFFDDKIQFCTNFIKEIENNIQKQAKHGKFKEDIALYGFIISVSPFEEVKNTFQYEEDELTIENFEENNIIFMDDESEYISKIFEKIMN